MKPQKQQKIIKKIDLYETCNYDLFEPDLQCQNPIRVNYLCTKARYPHLDLPILEVTPNADKTKLKILNDQDAYLAAIQLGEPIRFYVNKYPTHEPFKRNLYPTDDDLLEMVDWITAEIRKQEKKGLENGSSKTC